jgi:hypothetical protein
VSVAAGSQYTLTIPPMEIQTLKNASDIFSLHAALRCGCIHGQVISVLLDGSHLLFIFLIFSR